MSDVIDGAHLHDAFKVGCTLVELKSRIAVAAQQSSGALGPSIRLSSVWRAGFGQLAMLLKTAFPKAATAGTLYDPPGKEALPYLYPPEPDYANVGVIGVDEAGAAILGEFKLYDVTRRAINCLTVLYVNKDESLIPDMIAKQQAHLTDAILSAPAESGTSGASLEPIPPTATFDERLQRAKAALTARTLKFLDAWDGYIRENYYGGGVMPNNELELVAYEAGYAMCSMSWGISVKTMGPLSKETLIKAWKDVFWPQDVIRLKHQISSLSSALDEAYCRAYYAQHPNEKPGESDAALDAALPSHAIQAVKQSLTFWERTVTYMCSDQDGWGDTTEIKAISEDMRAGLIQQANIWQTLMTGQQNLSAFTMETVTQKIMHDVSEKVVQMAKADLPKAFQSVRETTRQVTDEIRRTTQAALEDVRQTAVQEWNALSRSLGGATMWLAIGVVAALVVGVAIALSVGIPGQTGGATTSSLATAAVSAIGGWFGLRQVAQAKDAGRSNIEAKTASATATVNQSASEGASRLDKAGSTGQNLLERIEGTAQEAAGEVVKSFERAYAQVHEELKGLGRSVAVSYPLLEFYGSRFKVGDDKFLTTVLWTDEERQAQIERIARAALGPLATLLAPSVDE